MGWTPSQQRAIDERNANILVSAAAGSGKTAVLVERIINKMTDEKNPKDIDEFLVVTFTRAAAAQMREKIAARIEKLLEKEPDNEHLMKQAVLVNRADITTIDSFCLRIVKENFGLLGIDSGFNIGDAGIMELIKNDVLDALFDKLYDEKNTDFIMLLDVFGCDRNDDELKENVLNIHRIANGFPRPDVWLEKAKAALTVNDMDELMNSKWMSDYKELVKAYAGSAKAYVNDGKKVCLKTGGPDKNLEVSESDLEAVLRIDNAGDYDELRAALDIKWTRLKTCKGDAYDTDLIEEYKAIRERYKTIIKKLNILTGDSSYVLDEIKSMAEYLIPLIDLVRDFSKAYEEEKKKRKLMEFSDVEHLAYKLVCSGYDENNKPIPTGAAKRISERYDEIFIDEYQDSNYLQEDILYSVSGISDKRYNMFMVGDVKQSIYKFRMARPDLFLSKYKTFTDKSPEIKIELNNNFRSRKNVLNTVNYFFYQLMHEDLGGIEYDNNNELVPTKDYSVPDEAVKDRLDEKTEILFVESFETGNRLSETALEAYAMVKRIKEIVDGDNPQFVYDDEKKIYRKASYRDIVILSRSIKGFGEEVYNVLTRAGIPAYLEESGGYFEAVEIRTIMSLLSVVDNIRQDIPLAAVLLSPMAKLNENELSMICDYSAKKLKKKHLLYDRCMAYIDDNDDYISDKLKKIFEIIDTLREDNKTMSISSLIFKALEITNYYNYAISMPLGDRRRKNINMLLEKAYTFEEGTYKGLFNFLRYIDKMKINEVDFGEALMFGDDEDVVRIMTMHKSKGLEFPIVFVSGLGKGINYKEFTNPILISSDYYLVSNYIDRRERYKKKTIMKEAVRLLSKSEMTAEELRILYVALTRAKEKLIITGCDKNIEETFDKLYSGDTENMALPIDIRAESSRYLLWIMACMKRYEELKPDCDISFRILGEEDLCDFIGKEEVKKIWTYRDFHEKALEDYDKELYDEYKKLFLFKYPYEKYVNIKNKMSISEIKKMKAYDGTEYDADDACIIDYEEADFDRTDLDKKAEGIGDREEKTEKFRDGKAVSGAERGTIIHKFMELLNFKEAYGLGKEELLSFINGILIKLKDNDIFNDEEAKAVNPYKIRSMLMSDLGQRMIKADLNSKLKKEQQFSAGIPADMIFKTGESSDEAFGASSVAAPDDNQKNTEDDQVIVQGIIDAFFYEDGNIILMDYKTDFADEKELIGRYRTQLEYYAYVLEKITGLKVLEKLIYSFYLEKEIKLD